MDSDPLLDRKQNTIERVQSSEFNRLHHGQCIGCNGLELNRMVCDRLIWDVWQLCQWRSETVLFTEQNQARWPPFFFLSQLQEKCIRKVLAVFEKNSRYSFFLLQRFGLVNPWTCNWNTYKSLLKTEVFDLSFWKKEHGYPQFFLMSGVVMKQRTDTEKISQFLGRIRTGSIRIRSFKGSVERWRPGRHFCSLLPYFLLSWLQIFNFVCLSEFHPLIRFIFKKTPSEKRKVSEKPPKTPLLLASS